MSEAERKLWERAGAVLRLKELWWPEEFRLAHSMVERGLLKLLPRTSDYDHFVRADG